MPQGERAPVCTTRELIERPGPSAQEEFFTPTWDETPCSNRKPLDILTLYVAPLDFVITEMKSVSVEK